MSSAPRNTKARKHLEFSECQELAGAVVDTRTPQVDCTLTLPPHVFILLSNNCCVANVMCFYFSMGLGFDFQFVLDIIVALITQGFA